jgi:hypothetical protein
MTFFDVFWTAFVVLGLSVELVALVSPERGDTASEHVWKWLRVRDARPTAPFIVLRVLTAIACVWLAPHFSMGWLSF